MLVTVLAIDLCQIHCQSASFSDLGDNISFTTTLSILEGVSKYTDVSGGKNRCTAGHISGGPSTPTWQSHSTAQAGFRLVIPLPLCLPSADIPDGNCDFSFSETNMPLWLLAKTSSQDGPVMVNIDYPCDRF